ncbi:peptidoglycan-binding domain-containing protein [Streptomyces caniscabiei]|uniref:Peptidoglycan-binding protein n=1 Tax=Streptomyces caniscabiei TaxID=2746961 RepID=A0A927QRT3_9ACTN|nr:peptidoglycan-binding domain-containing protein [Streptomyces caniscabiei]MBD9729824.1 peptidoglycan-binding protein [Streptomyces caniscabiei]MDX3515533.1 peptidoglycan-binding domain-containing protein [Streptomyces caniscabiei]MDX3724789.1 peptidoglycan-binding domain-containing protein [Streptomyces caniscabiei]WEO29008.1 peptidoglycan-binding domain-containing protein [Streptomyces caniscabiei]
MSEPTAPVCPRCATPRAADGTPACSCGRLASQAHRDVRAAQAEAAEDFDPVRIRPFVQVGDDGEPHGTPHVEGGPRGAAEGAEAPADERGPADERDVADEQVGAEEPVAGDASTEGGAQLSDGRAPGGRRRRRIAPAAGVGAAAAAVLVTGAIIGGLFSYEAPSRDGSGTDDIRGGLPEAAGAQEASRSAPPSPTGSTASPSGIASASPEATPTPTRTTPTPSAAPTRVPSGSDATVTAAPAPTAPDGPPPVLGLGDRGAEVTELQLRLRQAGLYNGDADGDYDREVESAVRGYQLTRVLLEDESGVYGEATRAALESETSEP